MSVEYDSQGSLVHYKYGRESFVPISILALLAKELGENPCLPSLKRLKLRGVGSLNLQFLSLFVSPTLIRAEICLPRPSDSSLSRDQLHKALSIFPKRCHSLQELCLIRPELHSGTWHEDDKRVYPDDIFLSGLVSDMAFSLNRLREFRCDTALSSEAFAHVTSLPSLAILAVHIWPDAPVVFFAQAPLRSVYLSAKKFQDVVPVVQSIAQTNIDVLMFTLGEDAQGEYFLPLCAAIGENEAFRSVTHLFISASKDSDPDEQTINAEPQFSAMQPLLRLLNIKVFSVTNFAVILDDAQLEMLSQAWPRLYRLNLSTEYLEGPHITSGVSPAGLISLVRFCPELHNLTLIVDASIPIPESLAQPGKEASNSRIKWLDIGPSLIDDPFALALLLSDLLPNLKVISQSTLGQTGYYEEVGEEEERFSRGEQTVTLLKALAQTRRQKRLSTSQANARM